MRVCDRCGTKQAPYHPRTRVDGEMLCDACVKAPPGVKGGGVITGSRKALGSTREVSDLLPFFQGAPMTDIQVVAHDSGDGQTIYHCPFCGSGQVLARSDRTIECEFCHTAFTVQVQPEFSSFPQTVNGMPMEVPGMPGQVDPGAPVDPNAIGDDGSMAPGDPMAADGEAEAENMEGQDADNPDAEANPFMSSLHRTASGAWLDEENYLAHLAIINSPNPKATAAAVKAARKYGRIVQHGTILRGTPHYQEAWKLLREGVIGKLLMVKSINNQKRGRVEVRPDGPVPPGVGGRGRGDRLRPERGS